MPDYINDFNVQQLELISGTSVNYSFDVENDDVKVTITDENGNIVIGPDGQFASYFVYNSSNYKFTITFVLTYFFSRRYFGEVRSICSLKYYICIVSCCIYCNISR